MARFVAAIIVAWVGVQAAAPAAAQQLPSSRSGIVMFTLPADRIRVEEAGYTALKPTGADAYDILIRLPFDTSATAVDAVEMHARWLSTFYRVQPASMPAGMRHPGGFDLAFRSFYVSGADGRLSPVLVAVLKSGSKAAVIEFVAATPQSPQAVQKMLAFIDGCRLAHTQVVAGGRPPLTLYDLESTVDLIQWLIDAPLTPAQREMVRADIVDGWMRKDPETMAEMKQFVELRDQLAALTPAKANFVRRQAERAVVAAIRGETNRVALMLASVYDAAHPAIARGTPWLTRQQADAALELFYFMAGQLESVTAQPNAAAKAVWASALAQTWSTLPAETRTAIVDMPAAWALTAAAWPEMTPAMRDQVKASYAQSDVVRAIRADFASARNQLHPTPLSAAAPQVTTPTAEAKQSVDVSEEIAKMNRSYQATSSMLMSGYNNTISMMAGIGNMSGTRYGVR